MITEQKINPKLNLSDLKPKRKRLGTLEVPRKEPGNELKALPAFRIASLVFTDYYRSLSTASDIGA